LCLLLQTFAIIRCDNNINTLHLRDNL
jgi:hypothetical protein